MSKKFYVSPSSMKSWYTCHQQYRFRSKWTSEETPQFFQDGTDAHLALSGEIPEKMSMEAFNYYTKILKLREKEGYSIYSTEERQEVEIGDDIMFVRIIDAIGEDRNGEFVLIDYKTAFKKWKEVAPGIAGKGWTFQAEGYLIPPYPGEEWPNRIDFLLGPRFEGAKVYRYYSTPERRQEFMDALYFMKANTGSVIKNRGIACDYCGFAPMCYEVPGWEKLYERKYKDD